MTPTFDDQLVAVQAEIARFNRAMKDYRENHTKWSSKERAALKRSSMDLTRALTKLRQAGI